MAGNLNSGMCSPLCSDVCAFYLPQGLTIYYQLYKLTSQVSLVTALIEKDNFLYLSSFMDKYFSGNVFKFLIFFNLLTFNKIVLNLAGSLARSHTCSVL